MERFILYLLESSVLLAFGWLAYRYLLRDTGRFAWNRHLLLSLLLLAPLLPLLQITIPAGEGTLFARLLPVTVGESYRYDSATAATGGPTSVGWVLLGAYGTGLAFFALLFARNLRTIRRIIRSGRRAPMPNADLVLHPGQPTFSFGRTLVLNENRLDEGPDRDRVIAHELAHIHQLHTLDVLLAEFVKILFWFNPFSWKLKKAVQENCEFLADQAAVDGSDGREYARLILDQSIATLRLDAVRVPFHQSQIKRRIEMLTRNTTSRAMWRYLLVATLALPLTLFISCRYDTDGMARAAQDDPNYNNLTDYTDADEAAEFPGGMTAMATWLGENIQYPASAKAEGIEGKTMVKFQVGPDGQVSKVEVLKGFHPECDAEALRAVGSMPDWKPAMKDGKAIGVEFTLPVVFKLPAADQARGSDSRY